MMDWTRSNLEVHKRLVASCGTPSNWLTWWIMDGGDDADSLRAADNKGALNAAVETLIEARICLQPGIFTAVRPVQGWLHNVVVVLVV